MDGPTREQKTIDALIARGVADAPAGDDCPAAGVLAAFQERTLETDERERWLGHIADCRRCQALLAAIGRAETDAGAEQASPGWTAFRWWRSRVLAPLAAFSIVVLVWVADPWQTPDEPLSGEGRQDPTPTQGEQASAATELAQAKRAVQTTTPAVVVPEPTAARVTRTAAPPVREVAAVPRATAAAPSPLAPPAAPASAPPTAATGDAVDQPESLAAGQRGVLRDAASRLERARFDANATDAALLIVAPDPATRWRVAPDGAVERSDNGGATWRFQVRPGERVVAGSAPSGRVAWLVGENGLVLRTTDGESWEHTTAPVTTHLNDVDALDGLVATVSTADGRRFRTVDGGARWAPLP